MNIYRILFLIILYAVLPLGCGGGSGGGSNPAIMSPVAITVDNAKDVAGTAVMSVASTGGIGEGTSTILTSVDITKKSGVKTMNSSNAFGFKHFIYRQLERARAEGIVNQTLGVLTISLTETCVDGGSLTFNGNIAVQGKLSNGDAFSLSADRCSESGSIANGNLDVTINSISGDLLSPPYTLSISIKLSSLSITDNSGTFTGSGDMTITESKVDNINTTTKITGNSFAFSDASGTSTLSNYQLSLTDNANTLAYTFDIAGTVSSALVGGTVDCQTLTIFEGVGDLDPDRGVMKCSGSGGSSEMITAVDNANVRLDIDSDGDGIIDSTINTTWAAI